MRYAIVALILSFAIAAPAVAVSFPGRSGEYSEVAPGAFVRVPTTVYPGLIPGTVPITRHYGPGGEPGIRAARAASPLARETRGLASSLKSSADARTASLKADVAARQRLMAAQRQALAGLSYAQTSRATWSSKAPAAAAPAQVAPESAFVPAPQVAETAPALKTSRMTSMVKRSTIAEEVAARKASLKVAHKLQGPRTLGPPPPFRYKNTRLYRSWGSN